MKDQTPRFSLKKILILVTILALPGFCYYLLQEKGENRYQSLPIYGEKKLSGTFHSKRGKQIADTLYHTVQPFRLMDSDSSAVLFEPDTNIAVVNFFYTRNEALSKPILNSMKRIADQFQRNGMVRLYSISVDPSWDIPTVLGQERLSWGNYPQWTWLSGRDSVFVKHLAKNEFLLDVVYDPQGIAPIVHSSSLVLLDSHRRIRGYYDALVKEEVDKLADEIKLLLTEEIRNVSVKYNHD